MIKNMVKICMMILGNGILVAGIITEIDGIGRFAMIVFGVLFSMLGGCISFTKKKKIENLLIFILINNTIHGIFLLTRKSRYRSGLPFLC